MTDAAFSIEISDIASLLLTVVAIVYSIIAVEARTDFVAKTAQVQTVLCIASAMAIQVMT